MSPFLHAHADTILTAMRCAIYALIAGMVAPVIYICVVLSRAAIEDAADWIKRVSRKGASPASSVDGTSEPATVARMAGRFGGPLF